MASKRTRLKTSVKAQKFNTRMCVDGPDRGFKLRVFKREARGKHSPHLTVKCGCCDQSVRIYYGDDTLEINGVFATLDEWRRLFDPLLKGVEPKPW